MKSTVLCICLWCSLVSHAQEKLLVKGHFSKKHYGRELDDKAGNLFFVLEKGHVILPEAIYMFELSPVDAQRLKQEMVRVICFFNKPFKRGDFSARLQQNERLPRRLDL